MLNRKSVLVAAAIALAVCTLHAAPASAAITSSLSTTSPNPNSGPCPVTMNFTGSINGTAGTVFTYSFNRFVNSVQQVVNGGTMTMPSSGTIAVNDSIPIASSASGNTFDQVWVHNISGGQPDVYSNKVNFTVNCAGATPPPSKYSLVQNAHTLVRPIVKLHTQWWALREYEYKWVGATTYIPERGTGPCGNLCIGWYHLKNGDSFWLYHWNTYDRAFFGFDPSAFPGLKVSKATLTLQSAGGDFSCFGALGRAIPDGGAFAANQSTTFHAPYPNDGDFSANVPAQLGATSTFDVTSIVQGWVNGTIPNNGFVLRGKTEDNGSDGNDACSLGFQYDTLLTIEQGS
jgi:hypothetical protein